MPTQPKSKSNAKSKSAAEPDLSFLLLQASYQLRGLLDRLIEKHGLDDTVQPGMGPILYALYQEDDCTIREIGERVPLAPSTLTNTLKRMEKQGLVDLKKDASDGRAVRVHLTKLARKLEKDMNEMRDEVQAVLHGDFSKNKLNCSRDLLRELIERMEIHQWEHNHPSRRAGSSS